MMQWWADHLDAAEMKSTAEPAALGQEFASRLRESQLDHRSSAVPPRRASRPIAY